MRVRQRVRYVGHVQGVGFRMTTMSLTTGLDVHGYVRNEPDGSVLMDVEGSKRDVQELLSRIKDTMADRIDDVLIDDRDPRGSESGFSIQY